MKALVKTERGCTDLKLMGIPKPVCPDNGVLLKVRVVAVCGSDIHYYKDLEPMPIPQVMGHEFCGDIVEVGKDVKDWKVGEFVISRVPVYPCGECPECKEGHPERCRSRKSAGLQTQGAYTEYIVSFPNLLYRVPEGVSDRMAACCEPSAVCLHAVKRFHVNPEWTVAVSGTGLIGLLTIQFLHIYGVKNIIAIGLDSDEPKRFPIAKKFGAVHTINGQHRSAAEQVLEYTNGRGVDLAIDCVGAVPAIDELFKMMARGGTLGAIGVPGPDARVSVNWNQFVWRSQTVISIFYSAPEDWEELIGYMKDGKLSFEEVFTHDLKLEEWEQVFKNSSNPNYVKAVFRPNAQ